MNTNSTEQTLIPLPNRSNYTVKEHYFYDFHYNNIIIFVLLIAGICVGLPALVWALWTICQHCKSGGRISAFILLLLLNDLSELILSVFILSDLYSNISAPIPELYYNDWYDGWLYFPAEVIWPTFRICGLYLHQLVALESILSLNDRTCSAHIFSPLCSTILSILLWLVLFAIQMIIFKEFLNSVLCLLPFCILALTCILTCKAPPNHDHVPHADMKAAASAVLIVSTLTLFSVCAPVITAYVIMTSSTLPMYGMYETMSPFLVSMRVVSDPLLCILVCKEKLRAQTRLTHRDQSLV